jgi:hypothetical protein
LPAPIRFRCLRCRLRIKAPIQLLDQMCDCPRCGKALLVRPEGPPDCGPILMREEPAAAGKGPSVTMLPLTGRDQDVKFRRAVKQVADFSQ